MIAVVKGNRAVQVRRLHTEGIGVLHSYLIGLSDETKRRFGPHGYDWDSIREFHAHESGNLGFVAVDLATDAIVGYAVLKMGFLMHDSYRLNSHGLVLDKQYDCTFAPSVRDDCWGCGIGSVLFEAVAAESKKRGFRRIFLWGGVQSDNVRAVSYYEKLGFRVLGDFEYFGWNKDMCFEL